MRSTLRTRQLLMSIHYLLLVAGFSALGYCVIVACQASRYQAWARRQLQKSSPEAGAPAKLSILLGTLPHVRQPVVSGTGLVGRVDIPGAHISAMIAEGVTARSLSVAVGHVPGTALPGQHGNTVFAAHRDTFFRRLGELQRGDVIRVRDIRAEYTYRVTFTSVVNPAETWVLLPASDEILTLITCYPFHFVGAAPKRFIVRARRVQSG